MPSVSEYERLREVAEEADRMCDRMLENREDREAAERFRELAEEVLLIAQTLRLSPGDELAILMQRVQRKINRITGHGNVH